MSDKQAELPEIRVPTGCAQATRDPGTGIIVECGKPTCWSITIAYPGVYRTRMRRGSVVTSSAPASVTVGFCAMHKPVESLEPYPVAV